MTGQIRLRAFFIFVLLVALPVLAGCRQATSDPEAPTAVEATPQATRPVADEPLGAALRVDAGQPLGAISPYVYGTNFGPWVALRPETLPLAHDAGVSVLRYPGGAWGDKNDLQNYQIDQFMQLARDMGAEPFIHVRFPDSTPEAAAALVRYANVEKEYAIRFWAIGNEPSLYEAEGLAWTATGYSQAWREFYVAMKAVDPDITILGPEIHQFTGTPDVDPVDSEGNDWLRTFLAINGDLVDMVSVHRYPFPNNAERTPASVADLRANAPAWDDVAVRLRETVQEISGRDIPIAFTEVNSHWSRAVGGEATPDSLYSALWWGDVLGRLIRQRVEMVNHFLLVSGSESGFGMLGRYEARPTYFTYQMYKRFGHELVAADSGIAGVSVYAALRDDGSLTVMVINLTDQAITAPLELRNFDATEPAAVWLFDAEHAAVETGTLELGAKTSMALPARSMTLYAVR